MGGDFQTQLKELKERYSVTDKEILNYRRLFVDYDGDRNCSLTRAEILNILDFLSYKVPKEKFNEVFKKVKLNKSKQVEEIDYLKV